MDLLPLFLSALGLLLFLVLTQDFHIFPGAFLSKASRILGSRQLPPPQVESTFINSSDGTRLEVWKYNPQDQTDLGNYCAIVFHGNGGALKNFVFIQMWLAELGIPSYAFDYRGFGKSGGWPGERGIYRDSDAVWEYVSKSEGLSAEKIIVIGISVGSGPAARIASLHNPKLLLLVSAFTDLKSAAKAQPLIGFLAPLIWHKFPTVTYVKDLKTTHLLIAHGLKDSIVPPNHSEILEGAYSGTGKLLRLTAEDCGHNAAFYGLRKELKQTFISWL